MVHVEVLVNLEYWRRRERPTKGDYLEYLLRESISVFRGTSRWWIDVAGQLGEFFVIANRQLEVILRALLSRQFEHFHGKILENGNQVDGCTGTNHSM